MNVTKKKGAVLVKALGKPKAMKKRLGLKAVLKNNWQLYLLVLPAVIYFVVFNYLPLYGIQIAFNPSAVLAKLRIPLVGERKI